MKKILAFVFFCSLLSAGAQTGIVFNKLSYAQTLAQAKKERKPVLLYFHNKGCGACVQMDKKVISQKRVGDFYNKTFICHDVNTFSPAGEKTRDLYNVAINPAFIFLDPDGKMMHKALGVFSVDSFNLLGRMALDTNQNLASIQRRLPAMRGDSAFMLRYCYALRDIASADSEAVNGYLATQPNLASEHNLRFLYEFALIHYELTINLQEMKFMMAHRRDLYKYFDSAAVEGHLAWINNFMIHKAVKYQNEQLFAEASESMKQFYNNRKYIFVEMDGRTTGFMIQSEREDLYYRMEYYAAGTDQAKFLEARRLYLESIWNDFYELNNYAWGVYENSNDKERLGKALECAKRSVALKKNEANQDTYVKLLAKVNKK